MRTYNLVNLDQAVECRSPESGSHQDDSGHQDQGFAILPSKRNRLPTTNFYFMILIFLQHVNIIYFKNLTIYPKKIELSDQKKLRLVISSCFWPSFAWIKEYISLKFRSFSSNVLFCISWQETKTKIFNFLLLVLMLWIWMSRLFDYLVIAEGPGVARGNFLLLNI